MNFNAEELEAIREGLEGMIQDGFAEDDTSPIVTALQKVEMLIDLLDSQE